MARAGFLRRMTNDTRVYLRMHSHVRSCAACRRTRKGIAPQCSRRQGSSTRGLGRTTRKKASGSCARGFPISIELNIPDAARAGKGVLVYTNGNKYEGEFLNGKRHGQGVYWVQVGSCASPPITLTRLRARPRLAPRGLRAPRGHAGGGEVQNRVQRGVGERETRGAGRGARPDLPKARPARFPRFRASALSPRPPLAADLAYLLRHAKSLPSGAASAQPQPEPLLSAASSSSFTPHLPPTLRATASSGARTAIATRGSGPAAAATARAARRTEGSSRTGLAGTSTRGSGWTTSATGSGSSRRGRTRAVRRADTRIDERS